MNLFIASCIVIPFAGAIAAIFGVMSSKGMGKLNILPKVTCSAVFVASAVLAAYLDGENPLVNLIVLALILFTIADGLLDVNFIIGALCFMAGHTLMIIRLWPLAPSLLISAAIFAAGLIIMFIIFLKPLKEQKAKAIPLVVYAASLCAEMALAVTLPAEHGALYIMLAVGSVMFFISDIYVAKGEFFSGKKWERVLTMALYWGALYLYSSTLWII